jgi:hypothetical protein
MNISRIITRVHHDDPFFLRCDPERGLTLDEVQDLLKLSNDRMAVPARRGRSNHQQEKFKFCGACRLEPSQQMLTTTRSTVW